MNQNIIIEEQGLRDGLQTIVPIISASQKLEWINTLVAAGLQRIQIGSFVNPKLVPQMANTELLFKSLIPNKNVIYSALVLNSKGVERAIDCGVKHLSISLSASNTHSIKNTGKDIEASKLEFANMVKLAKNNNITIRAGIQCAFGCRYEGKINEQIIFNLVQHHLNLGIDEIALADSTGMGNPFQVSEIMQKVVAYSKSIPVGLHLHNTENKGYANLVAALQAGVTIFDTAFGGLGGCPFIKGATGNIATEDVVHLLNELNVKTNIDIEKIKNISKNMEHILGKELPGLMYKLNVI